MRRDREDECEAEERECSSFDWAAMAGKRGRQGATAATVDTDTGALACSYTYDKLNPGSSPSLFSLPPLLLFVTCCHLVYRPAYVIQASTGIFLFPTRVPTPIGQCIVNVKE